MTPMIPITPADQPTATDERELFIPDEVAEIFDEASVPDGPFSAAFGPNCVRLVNTKSGQVIREVQWADSTEYGRRILETSLATTGIGAPAASDGIDRATSHHKSFAP
jgi:hypothetical protein